MSKASHLARLSSWLLISMLVGCSVVQSQVEATQPSPEPTHEIKSTFTPLPVATLTPTKSPIPQAEFIGIYSANVGDETMALTSDRTIIAWGSTGKPYLWTDAGPAVSLAGGIGHLLVAKKDGTVWAEGYNSHGQLGSYPISTDPSSGVIPGLANTIMVGAGWEHSIALKRDGTVWTWGSNEYGQLGDGSTQDKVEAAQVQGLPDCIAVAGTAYSSMAVDKAGRVWAWGANWAGQLGIGSTADSRSPMQVINLRDVVAISGGGVHVLALSRDGQVWTWGDNTHGQMGLGPDAKNHTRPTPIPGLKNITSIWAAGSHSLALDKDGVIWIWGSNEFGQLGNGTHDDSYSPVQVNGLPKIAAIAGGRHHSVALAVDGSLWAWGDDPYLLYLTGDEQTKPFEISVP